MVREAPDPAPDEAGPSGPSGLAEVVDAIGPKVRELRRQMGLSLQQLAARAEVSTAAIHKVERGDMVPTVTTLLKLAGALDRPPSYFVDGTGDAGEVAWFTPAGQRPDVPHEYEGLALAAVSGPAERFRTAGAVATVAPGAQGQGRLHGRPAEHLVLVLEGSVEFHVAGVRYALATGDALQYPADRPHEWANHGRKPARLAWFALREA